MKAPLEVPYLDLDGTVQTFVDGHSANLKREYPTFWNTAANGGGVYSIGLIIAYLHALWWTELDAIPFTAGSPIQTGDMWSIDITYG